MFKQKDSPIASYIRNTKQKMIDEKFAKGQAGEGGLTTKRRKSLDWDHKVQEGKMGADLLNVSA